jgi:hypothetical protein
VVALGAAAQTNKPNKRLTIRAVSNVRKNAVVS